MNRYRVSVIIPVFCVEQYVERCARSLFEQDMDGLEFIFVNDCTPDNSMAVLESVMAEYPHLKNNIKVINMPQNGGVANARNAALAIATGEYLGFVDSDDWVESDMYSSLYRIAKSTGADIVGCDFVKSFLEDVCIVSQPYSDDKDTNINRLLQGQLFPSLCAEITRRSLFQEKSINFSPNLNFGEDKLVNVKLFTHADKIAYIHKPFYHYCLRNDSACVKATPQLMLSYFEIVWQAEQYLQEHNIAHKHQAALNCMKFASKLPFYRSAELRDIKRWRTTYPETNRHIFSYSIFGWKEKVELWLAIHHMWPLADAWIGLLRWQHVLRTCLGKNKL